MLSTMPASKYVVSQSLPLSLLLIDHEKDPYQGRNILHSSERRLLHGSQSIRTFPRINTLPGGAIGLSVGHSFKGGFEDEKSSFQFLDPNTDFRGMLKNSFEVSLLQIITKTVTVS